MVQSAGAQFVPFLFADVFAVQIDVCLFCRILLVVEGHALFLHVFPLFCVVFIWSAKQSKSGFTVFCYVFCIV